MIKRAGGISKLLDRDSERYQERLNFIDKYGRYNSKKKKIVNKDSYQDTMTDFDLQLISSTRRVLEIPLEKLGKKIGLSVSYLSQIEQRNKRLTREVYEKYIRAFNITDEYIERFKIIYPIMLRTQAAFAEKPKVLSK